MNRIFILTVAAAVLATSAMQPARADETQREKIKNSMLERKPQLDTLKARGTIGEDNKGYVAVVTGTLTEAEKKVVDAENADRAKVYAAIASRHGSSAIEVGQRRAIKLAEQVSSGEFIMNAEGKWTKKK